MTLRFVKVESWRELDIYSEMRDVKTTAHSNVAMIIRFIMTKRNSS